MDKRDIIACSDQLLLEHGEWNPLEFLILAGALSDEDYRRWRQGHGPELARLLHPSANELARVLQLAEQYLRKLKLEPRHEPLRGWPPLNAPLRAGSALLDRLCSTCWHRPDDRIQADLFQDNAAELATRRIASLLLAGQSAEARRQLAPPSRLPERTRTAFIELIDRGESLPEDPAACLAELDQHLLPLAQRQLGRGARHFLAPYWRMLGERLADRRFDANTPAQHASFAFAQAGAWRECVAAIEAEPDWQLQPQLLARHAAAQQQLRCDDQARLSWSILCWMHAEAAPELLRSAADAALARRWREYQDSELDWPAQDFPAWLLLADPHQARAVPAAAAPGAPHGQAYAALHALLHADSIDNRRRLRDRHAGMLAVYLRRHIG